MIPPLAVALGTIALGHLQTRKEREGVVHLYRYMSHVMGVVPDLQVTSLDDMMRLVWLAAWSEVDPDDSSAELTAAVLDAAPALFDVVGSGTLERAQRWFVTRLHHDLARLSLGHDYADTVGIAPLSFAVAALPLYAVRHAVPQLVRNLVPGANERAARRGHVERRNRIHRMGQRVGVRPMERDDAVESIRERDRRLRAA